jgi:hypothetical protein
MADYESEILLTILWNKILDDNKIDSVLKLLEQIDGFKQIVITRKTNYSTAIADWKNEEIEPKLNEIKNLSGVTTVDYSQRRRFHRGIIESVKISDSVSRFKQARKIYIEEKKDNETDSIVISGNNVRVIAGSHSINIIDSKVNIYQKISSDFNEIDKLIDGLDALNDDDRVKALELKEKLKAILSGKNSAKSRLPEKWEVPIATMTFQLILKLIDWLTKT